MNESDNIFSAELEKRLYSIEKELPSPEQIFSTIGIKVISMKKYMIKNIKKKDIICGVYVLIIDSGEKYVGMSTDMFNRLNSHLCSKKKMNRTVVAYFYETDNTNIYSNDIDIYGDDISRLEKWFIYKLEPELNILYPNIDDYKLEPQSHSCAICKNRPIDFCNSNKRINPEPLFKYRNDLEDDEYLKILMSDFMSKDIKRHESLKIYRKCPTFRWLKMAPFKHNDHDCFVEDSCQT